MTIRKGEAWGSPGRLAPDAPRADSDSAAAALVAAGTRELRITGGDLARTLGVTERTLSRDEQMLLPVDVLQVEFSDGSSRLAVAHVVYSRAGRPRWVAMNAAFVGRWNIAPRAHPGDGKVDLVTFDLGVVDWLKARARLPTGTHVPHPQIAARARAVHEITPQRGGRLQLDGRRCDRRDVTRISIAEVTLTVGV